MKNIKKIAAVIPVAGLSSRMKNFKPLLPLGAKTILETTIDLFKQNGISDVFVVTGHRSGDLEELIAKQNAIWVHNPDFHRGMFSTIKTGINCLKADCEAFFLLPADIPAIRPYTVKQMINAHNKGRKKIIYPVFEDKRGHPPLISTELLNPIKNFNKDGGLRACLTEFEKDAMDLEVCDRGIHMDADTPDDYRAVLNKFEHIKVPDAGECLSLVKNSPLANEKILRHGKKVAETALKLLSHLDTASPQQLDQRLIAAAALVHDIAKKAPNHAAKGAEILKNMGFMEVADIVYWHMNLKTNPDTPLNETEIVYFADKLVVGDQLVMDFKIRFKDKLTAYRDDDRAIRAISARLETVHIIKEKLSKILKKDVMEVFS